jgi:hypothetical protein
MKIKALSYIGMNKSPAGGGFVRRDEFTSQA